MCLVNTLANIGTVETITVVLVITRAIVSGIGVGTDCLDMAAIDTVLRIGDVCHFSDVGIGTLVNIATFDPITEKSVIAGTIKGSDRVGTIGLVDIAIVAHVDTLIHIIAGPGRIVPV